ncbi:hypothetical protein BYT27DRAFT_6382273 [Phlegmacium glaucopus]|nr:hypothetical protein BYT27DRAFT_6382273 [Phlegmacium glaucopus]
MKLLYNNAYWENILGRPARKLPLERRLHLIFSLVIFLQISVAKLLYFIFTSTVDEVKTRSSRFMGYTPSAGTEDTKFPPGMIFRAWLEKFPDAQEHMRNMIAPFAQAIVVKESDKMIRDVELKVKMKTLTLKGIQELLQPQRVMEKYHEHAPFTWKLLHTFAATPNEFRKQRARNMPANSHEGDEKIDDDWEDDPNLADDEPMKTWNTMQTPKGFTRNPVLVSLNL